MNQPAEPCIADGCEKQSQMGRKYCRGHRERDQLHKPVDGALRDWGAAPEAYLEAKAINLAEAKDTDDKAYRLALRYLRRAALKYARAVLANRPKVATTPQTPRRG
jgi:hypothetical protein